MSRTIQIALLLSVVALFRANAFGAPPTDHGKDTRLHSSLDEPFVPILEWRTENYIVRVDDLGHSRFRYTAWDSDAPESGEPNLVLRNGYYVAQGSGGNGYYEFENNGYYYRCEVFYIGSDETPPGYLIVLHEDQEILREPVVDVLYYFRGWGN
jgi:hypothetical protein